jgi:putative nucleotidyltransferase with HDIG domain
VNREEAYQLFTEYNTNDSLIKHGLAVEAAVRAYARKFGEDEEKWGIAGMLHDIDYERHPSIEEHGKVGAELLRAHGYPDDIVYAVEAHNDYHGLPRTDLLTKTIFACDEVTGLITATALVRPNKSIIGLEASSVRKKMKDKAFARGVNREDIIKGAAELGVDLNTHIAFVIEAMASIAPDLGLEG